MTPLLIKKVKSQLRPKIQRKEKKMKKKEKKVMMKTEEKLILAHQLLSLKQAQLMELLVQIISKLFHGMLILFELARKIKRHLLNM